MAIKVNKSVKSCDTVLNALKKFPLFLVSRCIVVSYGLNLLGIIEYFFSLLKLFNLLKWRQRKGFNASSRVENLKQLIHEPRQKCKGNKLID